MTKKLLYEPPFVTDISGLVANGQIDKGICMNGSELTFQECEPLGNSPTGGSCSPTGIGPQYGYCTTGNNAVEGCTSGSIH